MDNLVAIYRQFTNFLSVSFVEWKALLIWRLFVNMKYISLPHFTGSVNLVPQALPYSLTYFSSSTHLLTWPHTFTYLGLHTYPFVRSPNRPNTQLFVGVVGMGTTLLALSANHLIVVALWLYDWLYCSSFKIYNKFTL